MGGQGRKEAEHVRGGISLPRTPLRGPVWPVVGRQETGSVELLWLLQCVSVLKHISKPS